METWIDSVGLPRYPGAVTIEVKQFHPNRNKNGGQVRELKGRSIATN